MNADGDATKAAVAHDDGLDALLGARQRSVRLSRSVTADGKLPEHALTARQAQAAPRFLRRLRRNLSVRFACDALGELNHISFTFDHFRAAHTCDVNTHLVT